VAANNKWNEAYSSVSSAVSPSSPAVGTAKSKLVEKLDRNKKGAPTVTFSEELKIHQEDPTLADALREARMDVEGTRRRADKSRAERLLAPVLDASHRERIRKERFCVD